MEELREHGKVGERCVAESRPRTLITPPLPSEQDGGPDVSDVPSYAENCSSRPRPARGTLSALTGAWRPTLRGSSGQHVYVGAKRATTAADPAVGEGVGAVGEDHPPRRIAGAGAGFQPKGRPPPSRFGTSWAKRLEALVRTSRTPFAQFMSKYRRRKGVSGRHTAAGGLFPCVLPSSAATASRRPRSARRALRWRRRRACDVVMRLVFAASSFVALGSRASCPRALPRADTAAHIAAAAFVRKRTFQFVRLMEEAGAATIGSGRRGPALQVQLNELTEWERAHRSAFDPYRLSRAERTVDTKGARTAVLPVVAERIALPQRGATCALHEWLPPDIAASYLDPELLREDPAAISSRSKVHATIDNWARLLRRFDSSRILVLGRVHEIPRDAAGKVPRNGFFATYKDEDADRSVCSRAPRNRLEKQLGLARELLPHGSQFCELQLDTDEDAAVDADDRDNYYHKCRVSRKRALTNAIGPPMPTAALAGTVALEAAQARETDGVGAGTTPGAASGSRA